MEPTKKYTFKEAQRLNRHARRALGKIEKVKIVGTNNPIINNK